MKVVAVVVVFNPDEKQLENCIDTLANQVEKVFVVDNSSLHHDTFHFLNTTKIDYVNLGSNLGIGKAQNVGLTKAQTYGADFAILSDQDTIYPQNYVAGMLRIYASLDNKEDVAAIAPNIYDAHRHILRGFIRRKSFFRENVVGQSSVLLITEVIASGMFIQVKKLESVGLMNESFFIDWVDFEWCWRVQRKNLKIYGANELLIEHHMGNGIISIAGNKHPIHSSIRYYYIVRNGFYIFLYYKNMPLAWRINVFANVLRCAAGCIFFVKPRRQSILNVLRGFYHGLSKKLGE